MIKAVIFDFDGVIVESLDIKTIAFARLFETEDPSIVKQVVEYHKANGGVSRFDKFRYYYREILKKELSDETFNALCSRFSALVLDEVVKCPYVPGAEKFLYRFATLLQCYITSATPEVELNEILARRGLTPFLRKVVGAPTAKFDAVATICRETGYKKHEIVYVGDALTDYEAAHSNGIHFIARCTPENRVFDGIDCMKSVDLTKLDVIISSL